MRTTIRLEASLLKQVKEYAVKKGITITAVFENAVKEMLFREKLGQKKRKIKLPAVKCGGALPKVDLDNNASLLDVMENR